MIVIAASDKGGAGRSVTASNVLYQRALQGSDVCYVDFDFDFGSPTAGAILGISALTRGTTTGNGTRSYLLGRSPTEELWDVWQHSDRPCLRQRPPGTGRFVLVPGDANGGEFFSDDAVVDRCIDLFLRLHSEFELVLVDLSAGRSYAADMVIAATSSPGLARVTTRWLVFHRWTRQHILGAHGLVYGERGLLDIGEAHGRDRDRFIDDIRFVRTAVVDPNAPDLSGLRQEQLAWLHEANRGLQRLAAERGVGRSALLGSVPLDPVLQWREQLITDSDVWASRVANEATTEAFDSIAKKITDASAWEPL